jgi:hypothetical protein
MRHNTKARKDENVNFRVAKESKEMLVKNRIASSGWVKECCGEVSIG